MHTKSIATGQRKGVKWTSTARGPHRKARSIPLVKVVRDILKYADNTKEAKRIIQSQKVLVDKRPIRDHKFGVGLMDVVEIPENKKHFIVLAGEKGLHLKEVTAQDSKHKLCKVVGKKVVGKNKVQYNFHDGSNIISDKGYRVGDTVVVELPQRKPVEHIEYKKGVDVVVVQGRHTTAHGTVDEIEEGTTTRKSLTRIGDVKTLTEYVFPLGKHKALIE